ncbi:hypothetical protein DERP_005472 [Dermatophagoides pteronyssinus]|uniref:Epidermal cell surface receptor-like n=1 Tax=Dermatophagoides pteronyssinus TaxID=6956 RepID=A0ABQ8JN95_DERPT|nr:hypothetical protein DERP_005472 [Dermatophagoides pteronyssinus]
MIKLIKIFGIIFYIIQQSNSVDIFSPPPPPPPTTTITTTIDSSPTTLSSSTDLRNFFSKSPPSSASKSSVNHCHRCKNGGHLLSSLIIQEPNSNCISGHYFTSLKKNNNHHHDDHDDDHHDDRCDCDFVCARKSGQTCLNPSSSSDRNMNTNASGSNHSIVNSHCDPYLKLFCNQTSKLCEGSLSLKINHIKNDSVEIEWKSFNNRNPARINNEIYLAHYVPQPLKLQFDKINSNITELNNNNNGHYQTRLKRLKPNTNYIVKVISNHREELSIFTTKANILPEILPKVLVTYRNASSITIVFDDFKPDLDTGYAIHYRPINNNNGFLHHHSNQWLIIKSNGKPFYTLTGLKPNSPYMIQIFTWNDSNDHKQILCSEIIETNTENGCFYRNRSYELNEIISNDCEQICQCSIDSIVNCRKRCESPYLSINEAKKTNLKCTFVTINHNDYDDDKCCLQCMNVDGDQQNNHLASSQASYLLEHESQSTEFVGKPGICPTINSELNLISDGHSDNQTTCMNECQHDYHCTGVNKCCKNYCGLLSCQMPINYHQQQPQPKQHSTIVKTTNNNDDDCPLKCDPNSQCRFIEKESAYRCICRDDYNNNNKKDDKMNGCHHFDYNDGHGDGDDKNQRKHQCQFQNKTYHIGQTFEYDCSICQCSEALEIECKRKCIDYLSEQNIPKNCHLIDDIYDPICCKKQICHHYHYSSAVDDTKNISTTCHHSNQTYNVNETFNIGCELKCLCQTNGQIECQPRCFDDNNNNGYHEQYCHLRPDPDDPDCCKISICDYNSTITEPKLLIEMAESINSTAIKFRLLLFNLNNNNDNDDDNLTINYGRFNQTIESDNITYQNEIITKKMQTIITNDSKEILLTNLQPETDYSVYFQLKKYQSNTVVVRTFPNGIDHTFKGCFHGSDIIQVGEIFYDGDCEFKCICKEGGIRDCIERCPIFVDLIGLENCHMIQSPDDSCCTIPICDGNNNEQQPSIQSIPNGCLSENGKHYQIGDQWTNGDGCMEKTCTCMFNKLNNTTEIKCKNHHCPEILPSILKPNDDCPSPKLIQTNDPCVCPYVVCENNINPLDMPNLTNVLLPTIKNNQNYCEFKGNKIGIGEEFYDSCRAICLCNINRTLDCHPIQCEHNNFGPHTTKCLEWEIDPLFVPRPPNCCPEPKCKNDGSCSYAGIRFPNYQTIPQELLPCHKRCICDTGMVRCRNICPDVPDEPPLGLPCPKSLTFRGHLPGDDCCIHWQCREQYNHDDKIYGKCSYNDKIYKLGEYWDDNQTEIHRRCQCKITNGILHVLCDPGLCQPITERFLEPTAECRTPTVVTPKDVIMCPYVICNNTGKYGDDLDHLDIVAINATSVRIRFTIPSIYVGLLGHAEVHYTTDINIPRNKWNIQKFARPKRLFDIPNIEYHLGNLQPNTNYFLQIEILIESLKTGPISEIYKIFLPPLPRSISTTIMSTTTTTSTLPPVIMLDMNLTATIIDHNSLRIEWRPFTPQERKFIDGLQVRYRKTAQTQTSSLPLYDRNNDDNIWLSSQILHRDITFYVINKLEPETSYLIDLQFQSIDQINANIISSKPILIETPSPSSTTLTTGIDNFNFHILPDDVSIDNGHINIELKNLPKPLNKFINVGRIHYQNIKTMDTFYHFVNIDDDDNNENGKISFSNLLPNTRYKLWIDLYLTNGQIITSNTIDLITNFDSNLFKDKNGGAASSLMNITNSSSRYLFGLTILSIFMFTAGTIFFIITCICLRRHSTAAITRVCISEAAYDNPTYKV